MYDGSANITWERHLGKFLYFSQMSEDEKIRSYKEMAKLGPSGRLTEIVYRKLFNGHVKPGESRDDFIRGVMNDLDYCNRQVLLEDFNSFNALVD